MLHSGGGGNRSTSASTSSSSNSRVSSGSVKWLSFVDLFLFYMHSYKILTYFTSFNLYVPLTGKNSDDKTENQKPCIGSK